jgi:peptide/nickel transport system ATP-binding protein
MDINEVTDFENYVLYIDNLSIEYTIGPLRVYALSNFTLGIKENESIGIVGESGCGKSTLAMAIAHILPPNAKVTSGKIYFKGQIIVDADMGASFSLRHNSKERKVEEKLKLVRWKGISVIFQGALDSLNPLHKVGTQLADIFIFRESLSKEEANARSMDLLNSVGLDNYVFEMYPHQLSGGMKQRVVIAMAVSLRPALIIADEPTTSLDVITQYRIIEELMKLKTQYKVSLINISHDVSLISRLSDRLIVMYAGRMAEKLPSNSFKPARHPYTHMLVNSIPHLEGEISEIFPIEGAPPTLVERITGCPFYDRCNYRITACKDPDAVEMRPISSEHEVACVVLPVFAHVEASLRIQTGRINGVSSAEKVIEAVNLSKVFQKKSGIMEKTEVGDNTIKAVDHVNLHVAKGEIVSLVGETGSGKTTLSRLLGLLETPTEGEIVIKGEPANLLSKAATRKFRQTVQTIFQDPFQSINPRFSIYDVISEPLKINRQKIGVESIESKVRKSMEEAELTPTDVYIDKYPHQISGGQKQRVSIARGLILNPEIIIADEPISMLDVSLRAGVLNLLGKLRSDFDISILYITHDIASARYLSDRIYVMYRGQIVESGVSEEVIRGSSHPYTISLVLASIGIQGEIKQKLGEKIFNQGESIMSNSCKFEPRCPFAEDICSETEPELSEITPGHFVKCHFAQSVAGKRLTEQALDDAQKSQVGINSRGLSH